ncbi:hypothetical protein [Nesterenkonia sp. Act20]|uniref:hypothetical protein n=1 Tax=Nesterenkonia sp. Act20 TaxID=1483432 RepID=UPI001C44D373|nr:hypothetical protein [Nesterenkonia sp. Act20]
MTDNGAARRARVLTNGTIHSPTEPYADAMLVEDGLIAWVGSAETAETFDASTLEVEDLDRALVAPAFVGWADVAGGGSSGPDSAGVQGLAAAAVQALDAAAAQGCGAVRLNVELSATGLSEPSASETLEAVFSAAAAHAVRAYPVVTLTGLSLLDTGDRMEALERAVSMLGPVDLLLDRPAAVQLLVGEVVDQLLEVRLVAAQAKRQLLLRVADEGESATSNQAPAPAELVAALVDSTSAMRAQRRSTPGGLPTVLVGFDSAERQDWEALLNTGVQVLIRGRGHLATALSVGVPVSAVGSPDENPWAVVTRHVHHEQDPVSVRAGFNAQTRGAYRSLPEASGTAATAAQLDPGARATYGVWEVDSLAVQTPDSRTAAWSTDVRARTPLLPYLDGETLPALRATVIDGDQVHPRTS